MELTNRIVSYANLHEAYKRVVANKGAAGVDGMSVDELWDFLKTNRETIRAAILSGDYRPNAVKGIYIPKPGSSDKRLLGIPTVIDRFIQQAIQQELYKVFNREFSPYSYGFRKGKSAQQAVKQALSYANSGFHYVVDTDLSKFFDRVNHDLLMSLIAKRVSDKPLLRLIRCYLQSGIMIDGVICRREEGTPQSLPRTNVGGSPLSPLLSNILLNELDKELTARGHKFVRYADDFSIYVRSKPLAQRVMQSIWRFIENKLKLQINEKKSAVRYVGHMELLGYGIYRTRQQNFALKVSETSWQRFKSKCKEITRKTKPYSYDYRVRKLRELGQGWISYFRYAGLGERLKRLDHWLGSRLRYCIWKTWKRIRTRIRNLARLGVPKPLAIKWGLNRKGGWHIVHTPIFTTTITVERLKQRGFVPMSTIYRKYR
jgi:RNA-directed DNA polymerase